MQKALDSRMLKAELLQMCATATSSWLLQIRKASAPQVRCRRAPYATRAGAATRSTPRTPIPAVPEACQTPSPRIALLPSLSRRPGTDAASHRLLVPDPSAVLATRLFEAL